MVTVLNNIEFENVWNGIVNCDSNYRETHWGAGIRFTCEKVEKNKPEGWNKLREIVDDIEKRCVVYYYCETEDDDAKWLYFIVFGENARDEVATLSFNLRKMVELETTTLEGEKERMKSENYGTDNLHDTVAAHCPLF